MNCGFVLLRICQVSKTNANIIDLSASLSADYPTCPSLDTAALSEVSLLQYFEQILVFFTEDLLNVSNLVAFFDNDVQTSNMTSLQLKYLRNKVICRTFCCKQVCLRVFPCADIYFTISI